jgi:hypothetical protein
MACTGSIHSLLFGFNATEIGEKDVGFGHSRPEWISETRDLGVVETQMMVEYRKIPFEQLECKIVEHPKSKSVTVTITEPGKWFTKLGLISPTGCSLADSLHTKEMVLEMGRKAGWETFKRLTAIRMQDNEEFRKANPKYYQREGE